MDNNISPVTDELSDWSDELLDEITKSCIYVDTAHTEDEEMPIDAHSLIVGEEEIAEPAGCYMELEQNSDGGVIVKTLHETVQLEQNYVTETGELLLDEFVVEVNTCNGQSIGCLNSGNDDVYKQGIAGGDDSDDNVPLARLKEKLASTMNVPGSPESLCDQDDDADNTPTADEYSTDSNESVHQCSKTSKKRAKTASNRTWKKSCRRVTVEQKSRNQHRIKTILTRYHVKRLDNLLASNGLKRIEVAPDGDCLMAALVSQLETNTTVEDLRSQLSVHFSENVDHYIHFLHEDTTGKDIATLFSEQVTLLKSPGQWKSKLTDCVPLAAANVFQRPIKIFSSDMSNPVYDVKPDLGEGGVGGEYIYLAYLKIKGREHYDSVVPSAKSSVTATESTQSDQTKTPTKQRHIRVPELTPHKEAVYNSPQHKKLSRKRVIRRELWKRNVRKQNRVSGQEYITVKGKIVSMRTMKLQTCRKCKFKCTSKVNEDTRRNIFQSFWELHDYNRQRDYICQRVESAAIQRPGTGRKHNSYKYYFLVDSERIRVCKTFFMDTLDVRKKTIECALKKNVCGTYSGTDMRGKSPSANKTPVAGIEGVRHHIESFPTMEGHYVRKQSRRKYLQQDLNITKMWHLYKSVCNDKGIKPVGQAKYRKIFCEEYNYSFFKPEKDQCSLCTKYNIKTAANSLTDELKNRYANHMSKKEKAREQKTSDKSRAKTDKSFHAETFDLQAVLNTPCTMVGELYYKRKLSCYNLSFYSLGNEDGKCYVWDETQGGRGSCEIATCLLMQINAITKHNSGVNEITFYSDTCGGQNLNQYVVSAYLFAINTCTSTLTTINHKFFEPGHSQMESDSMHSAIEGAKKKTVVYVPSQWHTVISFARRRKPYVVVPIKFSDIFDLKAFTNKYCPNMKISTTGSKINWLKLVWIKIQKSSPDSIFVNESYDETQFVEIKVTKSTRSKHQSGNIQDDLSRCYDVKIPISNAKKKDLISLVYVITD